MRFEALQARSASTEKLLGEAREHIMARTEEIRADDRRLAEAMLVRDTLSTRFAELEAEHTQYEAKLKEFEQSQSTLLDRNAALARALNGKESALNRAGEAIQVMSDRIAFLQAELETSKQTAGEQLKETNAALRREKLERAVVEGALETGRKDFARLMREVLALQRRQSADKAGRVRSPPTPPEQSSTECRIAGPKARRCCFWRGRCQTAGDCNGTDVTCMPSHSVHAKVKRSVWA